MIRSFAALEAKATGTTMHIFNYPGTHSSGGKVFSLADVLNSGIAYINDLIINKGIDPDDIILQGDCFGSAISEKVKQHFKNHDIQLRSINSNSFISFEGAINDKINSSSYLWPFRGIAKLLLKFTGWDLDVSEQVVRQDPYLLTMNREGDTVLVKSRVSEQLQKNIANPDIKDTCPEEYRVHRDKFENEPLLCVKKEFVSDDQTKNEPHMMDLYKLETQDGNSVFDFINEYIDASNKYIENGHRQEGPFKEVPFIGQKYINLTEEELDKLWEFADVSDYYAQVPTSKVFDDCEIVSKVSSELEKKAK